MIEPARRPSRRAALPALALLLAAIASPLSTTPASAQFAIDGRQVTVFGVLATPGSAKDDPKLKDVLPQLRMLVPNHGFKLLKVESKRVLAGEVVACDLGDGFVASAQLVMATDPNGKVQIRFDLAQLGVSQYQTIASTPPNQIFYINRMLPDGERLILGVGAR